MRRTNLDLSDLNNLDVALLQIPDPKLQPTYFDFGLPLLHRTLIFEFTWAGKVCAVHAQRKALGSELSHPNWYYVRLTDLTFHEVQYSRLYRVLTHPPMHRTVRSIGMALEHQPNQTPESLRTLVKACGL